MTWWNLAIVLFLMIDIIGAIPLVFNLVEGFEPRKQLKIVLRELLLGLGLMVGFCFGGHAILEHLGLGLHSIQISGGVILFLLALQMLFKKGEI